MPARPFRQVRHGWYTSLALRHATLRGNIRTGWRYCHRRRACICARVKWYQRDWCLQRGIDLVRWTYDPLMQGINAGLPSDRLLAEWHLHSVHVAAHAARQSPVAGPGDRVAQTGPH